MNSAYGTPDEIAQWFRENNHKLSPPETIQRNGSTVKDPAEDRRLLPKLSPIGTVMDGIPTEGNYIVDGLLECGCLYEVAAKPKVGKSILLLKLAIDAALGGEWLGRQVTVAKVALFQLEDGPRTIKRRLTRMTGGEWPSNLYLHTAPFRLNEENFADTTTLLSSFEVVVVDPIIAATSVRDWNSPSEVRLQYDYWRRLAREMGCLVVIAGHHRKMAGEFGDAIAGSI